MAPDAPCNDCAAPTYVLVPGGCEWYMVKDAVWEQANADQVTILCIGCLEQRLGRQLVAADFAMMLINFLGGLVDSARLRDRKNGLVYRVEEDPNCELAEAPNG